MDIGAKIKLLRIKNQLTLEELANRSELTKGFLSQVETISVCRNCQLLRCIFAETHRKGGGFLVKITRKPPPD